MSTQKSTNEQDAIEVANEMAIYFDERVKTSELAQWIAIVNERLYISLTNI